MMMSSSKLILGYTRSGKPVLAPTRGAPDTNNIDAFRRTRAKFPGWSKADHMDASHILLEHASAGSANPKVAGWCTRWSSVHWDIGGRWTSPEIDAYLGKR